ncbi:hypothetical protein CYMTET_51296 [Cymbomonas tetramitiformis]|uniref:Cyclic nucleotide-binding domain-containing protein n=1 Tax=Cymbomonas tetramitiformis TaxID=36881 RepID=A0AAE0BLJ7_9CHLO|nr:hypothetical protein CYMTET_51296 [Cymbomonas tetramitiformis]
MLQQLACKAERVHDGWHQRQVSSLDARSDDGEPRPSEVLLQVLSTEARNEPGQELAAEARAGICDSALGNYFDREGDLGKSKARGDIADLPGVSSGAAASSGRPSGSSRPSSSSQEAGTGAALRPGLLERKVIGEERLKIAAAKFQKLVLHMEDVQKGWMALAAAAFSPREAFGPREDPATRAGAVCEAEQHPGDDELELVQAATHTWQEMALRAKYSCGRHGCPCKRPMYLMQLKQLLLTLGIPGRDQRQLELMMQEMVLRRNCQGSSLLSKELQGPVYQRLMRHARMDVDAQQCSLMEAVAFGDCFRRSLLEVEPATLEPQVGALAAIKQAFEIVEEMYTAFAMAEATIEKTMLLQMPKLLGEVGSVVFSEMFPLQVLPDELTKADVYMLVSLYANGHLVMCKQRDLNLNARISGTSKKLKQKMKLRNSRLLTLGDVAAQMISERDHEKNLAVELPVSSLSDLPDLDFIRGWAYLYQLLMVLPGSWYMRPSLVPLLQGWWLEVIVEGLEAGAEARMKAAFELTTRKDTLSASGVREFLQHLWRVPDPLPEWMQDHQVHFLFVDLFNAAPWTCRARFMRRLDTPQKGLKEHVQWAELQAALADYSTRRSSLHERTSTWGKLWKDTVMLPDTWLLRVWHRMILFIYMFNYCWVPMRNCFVLYPSSGGRPFVAEDRGDTWLAAMDIVEVAFDLILLADVVLHMNTAFVNEQSILVTDRITIRAHYTSNGFLLDIGCVAPLNWLALVLGVPRVTCGWLRMNRLVGIFNVIATERRRIEGPLMDSKPHLAVLLFLTMHTAGCVWYFLGNLSVDSWYQATEPEEDSMLSFGRLESSSVVDRYLLCFYWCFNVMMTWAMVTPAPVTFAEMTFATFLLVLNPTLVAYTTSKVSSIVFEGEKSKAEEQEHKARMVKLVKSSTGFPPELTAEIVRTATVASESHSQTSIHELYTLMSFNLRVKVARFIGRDTLNKVPVMRSCSPQFLDLLAVVMRELTAHKDELLFDQDAVADTIFIIIKGKVQETQAEPKPHSAVKGPGSSLGELPVLLGTRHTSTAQVKGDAAELFTVQGEELVRLLHDFPNDETALHEECLRCFVGDHGAGGTSEAGSRPMSASSRATSVESFADNSNFSAAIIHRISVMLRQNRLAAITKLCQCAKAGNLQHMKQLLKNSPIDLDDADTNGRTVLAVAASEGQVEVVQYLLSEGANAGIKDRSGNTPLNDAVREGHGKVALELKSAGFKLDYAALDMAAMLCEVAYSGSTAKMQQLVLHGGDINLGDYDGRTALMLAASSGRLEMVDLLLKAGADMEAQDQFGNTALDDAVREKHLEVQKRLCQAGARLRSRGIQLCEAAAVGDLETLILLCKNGADANEGDYDKRTGLHLAASNGHSNCVDFLLEKKDIDINAVDKFGGTPLDDALRHQNSAIVVMLAKRGGVQGSHSSVLARTQREEEAQELARRKRTAARAEQLQAESKEEAAHRALGAALHQLKLHCALVEGALKRILGQLGIAPLSSGEPAESQVLNQLIELTASNSIKLSEAAQNVQDLLEDLVEDLQTSFEIKVPSIFMRVDRKKFFETVLKEARSLQSFMVSLIALCNAPPEVQWDPVNRMEGECALMSALP